MTDRTALSTPLANLRDGPIDLTISPLPVPYPDALAAMEAHVDAMVAGTARERVWFLEHPPLYTGGTTAKREDLRDPDRFDVFETKRGGQYTYHGPGQRVAYVMLDLNHRTKDVRRFVADLERWLILTLSDFGVTAGTRNDRVGVWVDRSRPGAPKEDKVAALGVRLRRWVSFHGIALNVEPDLSHFDGITPCGIASPNFGVTSLVDLGHPVTMDEVDAALIARFADVFGPLVPTMQEEQPCK